MGCIVNGPGESKAANIGISLPGTGEAPHCPVFIDGQHARRCAATYEELAAGFQQLDRRLRGLALPRREDGATERVAHVEGTTTDPARRDRRARSWTPDVPPTGEPVDVREIEHRRGC